MKPLDLLRRFAHTHAQLDEPTTWTGSRSSQPSTSRLDSARENSAGPNCGSEDLCVIAQEAVHHDHNGRATPYQDECLSHQPLGEATLSDDCTQPSGGRTNTRQRRRRD